MKTLSIIPVKQTAHAKSRLAGHLSPRTRKALVLSLLTKTIRTFKSCLAQADILIVGRDTEVRHLARRQGVLFLEETGVGLNRALHQATGWALHHGYRAILISPLDLPFLRPEDIHTIMEIGKQTETMVIAPDQTYIGTNMLFLNPPIDFKFCFGPGSYQRHLNQATFCGLRPRVFYAYGTYFDIDDYDTYQIWLKGQHKLLQTSRKPKGSMPPAHAVYGPIKPQEKLRNANNIR